MSLTTTPLIAVHFMSARWRWKHVRGETLEHFQEQRAQHMVAYAMRHAPFYRQYWVGYTPQDWRTLPLVDKQLMMANFDHFTTCGIKKDEAMAVALASEHSRDFRPTLRGFTVGLSSGTSGHRGLFVASRWEQAGWAGTILARTLHQLPRSPLHVAFFLRSNSNLYEQVGSRLIQFRYFDLMTPLEESVLVLNDFQPHIIVGPPSLLGLLSAHLACGQLKVKPQRLIAVAEVLEPQDKITLEASFHAPVHQIYQCTEGLLAVSCAQGALHIQEDLVALQLEPLPGAEARRFTPILTDLWRKTQPILRYRLNDVLQLATQSCACGSPYRVIQAIEGRCDDICYFESLNGEQRAFFPDIIRRMILLASPDIADYQVVQERIGHLRIHLAQAPGASFAAIQPLVLQSVQETIAQYACRPAQVSIEEGLGPLPAGMKRRRVKNLSSAPSSN